MNTIKGCFFTFLVIASGPLNAAIGCMDNSYHLTQPYDNKDYHFVACNCPCDKQKWLIDRNTCILCRHFHEPKRLIIIQKSVGTIVKNSRYHQLLDRGGAEKVLDQFVTANER
jgi:hypothetical protein